MAKKKITKEDISKLLNIHWNSVANKINGSSSFTVEEASQIRECILSLSGKLKNFFKSQPTNN